jgi:hypothetical protein
MATAVTIVSMRSPDQALKSRAEAGQIAAMAGGRGTDLRAERRALSSHPGEATPGIHRNQA